jgi:hypothetical protein
MTEHELNIVRKYHEDLARKGGLAGKGRKKEQLAAASKLRWDRYRARKAEKAQEAQS